VGSSVRFSVILMTIVIAIQTAVLAETRTDVGYGPSPSQAMRTVFPTATVLRVNVASPYALVSARGDGPLFGPGPSTEFLLQRFYFGWQVIEMARSLCPRQRGITASDEHRLLAGMPKVPNKNMGCDSLDRGPSQAVAEVRKLMYGPVVPYVRVVSGYAFSIDFGDGGSCGLFRHEAGRWELLGVCKGVLDPTAIERNHIPRSTVCALGLGGPGTDIKCPPGRAGQ
jgi:hypothetical protein